MKLASAARKPGAACSALGTAGLIALSRGHVDRACEHFDEALRVSIDFDASRATRSGGYVVLGRGRKGRIEEARVQYHATLTLLRELGPSERTLNDERWLRTYMAEAAYLGGCPDEARAVLDAPCIVEAMAQLPLPGLLARRWLGLAEVATGDVSRGLSRLAEAPSVHSNARVSAERVRFLAHLAVLYEAEVRIARELLDDDARGRALLALEHLPTSAAEGAFLGPHLDRARTLLRDRSTPASALAGSLSALIEACRSLE
ncbi:MAG: hypothetical protein H5U40_04740 [Polyangiaceae bacterium]|nr:hypothetical protein [Polyangiaceae bacterium]